MLALKSNWRRKPFKISETGLAISTVLIKTLRLPFYCWSINLFTWSTIPKLGSSDNFITLMPRNFFKVPQARFKNRISHVTKLMLIRKIYCFSSFALDSAQKKCLSLKLRANGRNNSQTCWAKNVGSCCVRVGSGVQTEATTPNNVKTCSASWEG